jgi:hypothetical protein
VVIARLASKLRRVSHIEDAANIRFAEQDGAAIVNQGRRAA